MVSRFFPDLIRSHRQQAGCFIDDDQGIVFVYDLYFRVAERQICFIESDGDFISFFQRLIELGCHTAVDTDLPVRKQGFNRRPAQVIQR